MDGDGMAMDGDGMAMDGDGMAMDGDGMAMDGNGMAMEDDERRPGEVVVSSLFLGSRHDFGPSGLVFRACYSLLLSLDQRRPTKKSASHRTRFCFRGARARASRRRAACAPAQSRATAPGPVPPIKFPGRPFRSLSLPRFSLSLSLSTSVLPLQAHQLQLEHDALAREHAVGVEAHARLVRGHDQGAGAVGQLDDEALAQAALAAGCFLGGCVVLCMCCGRGSGGDWGST